MTEKLPSFLGITPFGPYCTLCNESLSVQTGILYHGKEKHPECVFKNATIVREVQKLMSTLRSTHADDLSTFLTSERAKDPAWFCNGCFQKFASSYSYDRHLSRNKDCSVDPVGGGKVQCYVSICGRIGPKSCRSTSPTCASTIASQGTAVSTLTDSIFRSSTISKLLAVDYGTKVPTTLLTTLDQASEILAPFVRPDEDVRDLSLIYYPLLSPGFDGMMKQFLSYSAPQAGEDGILVKWLEAGREWLANYAAVHIANVSANVRSRLAEFEQRELDGTSVGTRTFTLRRGIPRLMTELDAALRFFYRYPTTIFDSFKSTSLLTSTKRSMIESAIIPKILFTAAAEEPDDHGRLPIACLYCLSRGFTTKGSSDLTMNECGGFASRISAMLHLLRAGVCGYLITLSINNSSAFLSLQEMEIVNRIQNGRVTNLLAPYLKRLRDMYTRKPPDKSNTVSSNGDITSGGFTFPRTIWSTIIPRIEELSRACFNEIFDGDSWKLFLEKPISMTDWARLEASVVHNASPIWLHDIVLQQDKEPVLAKVQSILELCFFGLGVGAVRHEEVLRIQVLSCQWHNSYLYFWTESFKRGSLKVSTTPKLVEHRLSLSLSRIVLLGRYAMITSSDSANTDSFFPVNSSVSMLGIVQDLFDFDIPPQMLNVRHLFTSIGNIILPETGSCGGDGALVSTSALTEKSGHTQGTGRRAYGTWLENSEEAMYDLYHSSLGESSLLPPPLQFTPLSDFVLESALKTLLGQDVNYRSENQKKMIALAANSILRHAFVGLPCGHGKSMSWLVPTLASYLAGRHVGLRIIVLPYKFLLGHIVHAATTILGLLRHKLIVAFLDSTQIGPDRLPPELEEGHLPNLLFLNLDAAATLLQYHLNHLQNLATRGILKRFYLDEFQQFFVEYCFRPAYQSLRQIGRIGAPVMCLSGSLPPAMAMQLMSYCGLQHDREANGIDIVNPTDPIGDGYSFDITVVDNIKDAVVDYVLKDRVGACHVLCSSIALVNAVTDTLSKHLSVLSVTGDSPCQEQLACAKSWSRGEHDVLVSTVVALVGNENKNCKTIVVAGFLFNVSSLVQAIGRLRPEQRGNMSKVHIFRSPIRSIHRRDAKLQSEQLFIEMVQAGCLTSDSKELFVSLFTPVGLQELLSLKSGCYLQHLSRMYGFVRLSCGRCGLCLTEKTSPDSVRSGEVSTKPKRVLSQEPDIPSLIKRPRALKDNVSTCKQVAEASNKATLVLFRRAKWVFCELQYRCLACGKTICNGECAGGCYRCGSRSHGYTVCTFDINRLSKILPNKGVCFGCFDTRQHLMTDHDMKSCPLKRRLKRLLFLDHQKSGTSFEEYLRHLYSSELSFVTMVASFHTETTLGRYVYWRDFMRCRFLSRVLFLFSSVSLCHLYIRSAWINPSRRLISLDCIQMMHDTVDTPLLPPDRIHQSPDNSFDGTPRSSVFTNPSRAREEYKRLRNSKTSIHRHRQFVFGAMYENLFDGYYEIDPTLRDYDLLVTLPSNNVSRIRVRMIAPHVGLHKDNLLSSLVEVGRTLSGPGNCRGTSVGDMGSMHAIGIKSASSKSFYVTKDNTASKVEVASKMMTDWMQDHMREVLASIRAVDTQLGVEPTPSLKDAPGSRMMVSVNLANSPHYDNGDTSQSVAVWVEEKPCQSKNWYFVLPNMAYQGSKGVVIRLLHGVVISWDGREIFHCTSKTKTTDGNKTYGLLWSGTRK